MAVGLVRPPYSRGLCESLPVKGGVVRHEQVREPRVYVPDGAQPMRGGRLAGCLSARLGQHEGDGLIVNPAEC